METEIENESESTGAEEQLPKAANLSISDLTSRIIADRKAARAAKTGTAKNTGSGAKAAANNEQAAEEETEGTSVPATGEEEAEESEASTAGGSTENSETEPEAEAQPDGEGEQPEGETTEGDESADEEEPATKGQKEMLKRINTLTARLKTAEAKLAAQAPGEQTSGPAAPQDFVEGNPAIREINGRLDFCDKALDWVEANPEGGLFKDAKGVETEISAAQAAVIRRNATRMQSELIAERSNLRGELRATFRQAEQKASAAAEVSYPWLKDPESPLHQEFNTLLKQIPQIRQQHFDWKEWLADAVAGRHARLKAAKAGKVGQPMTRRPTNPGAKPAAVVTRTQGMPRVNLKQKGAQEAEAQFKKSGNVKDLAKMLTQQRAARAA